MREALILHLVTDLYPGGAQSALVRLLAAQDRERFPAEVAWLKPVAQPALVERLQSLGVPVHPLRMTPATVPGALVRLGRLLVRRRPDILQCWLFHADLAGRLVGRLAGVPIILGSRRGLEIGGPWRERANRWSAPLVDRVIAVSEEIRRVEIERGGHPPGKVVAIPNGVDPRPYQALPPRRGGTPRLGTVARLHPAKGLDRALEAMVEIRRRHPDATLVIAGEGPERPALEALRRRLDLEGCVELPGHRNDIPRLLEDLDLFLLPSRSEGLSNSLLEAMAAGRAVVATAVGGTPEVVVDGETGLLVPPDDAGALAAASVRLLEDPDLRERLGRAGRERVLRHFTVDAMARRMEGLYRELLDSRRRR